MIINESTLRKIESILENFGSVGDINEFGHNKEIADGIKGLGKYPKMPVADSVKNARRSKITDIINNAGSSPTTFHIGGKK